MHPSVSWSRNSLSQTTPSPMALASSKSSQPPSRRHTSASAPSLACQPRAACSHPRLQQRSGLEGLGALNVPLWMCHYKTEEASLSALAACDRVAVSMLPSRVSCSSRNRGRPRAREPSQAPLDNSLIRPAKTTTAHSFMHVCTPCERFMATCRCSAHGITRFAVFPLALFPALFTVNIPLCFSRVLAHGNGKGRRTRCETLPVQFISLSRELPVPMEERVRSITSRVEAIQPCENGFHCVSSTRARMSLQRLRCLGPGQVPAGLNSPVWTWRINAMYDSGGTNSFPTIIFIPQVHRQPALHFMPSMAHEVTKTHCIRKSHAIDTHHWDI